MNETARHPIVRSVSMLLVCAATAGTADRAIAFPSTAPAVDCDASQMGAYIAAAARAGQRVADTACDWAAVTGLVEGYRVQTEVLRRLDRKLPRAGYKVSGTSAEARAAMGIFYPVVGILHRRALRPSGRALRLPAASAAVLEPDLLVRVSDDRINDARSLEEVVPFIDQIVPFAEVPLWIAPKSLGRSGGIWAAINAASGYGFVGDPVAVSATNRADLLRSLATIRVTMTDAQGAVVGGGSGADIFGNPLYSMIELNNEMLNRGERLKKGDYVSLGNFGKPVHPEAGDHYTLTYSGLPGGPMSVIAAFR